MTLMNRRPNWPTASSLAAVGSECIVGRDGIEHRGRRYAHFRLSEMGGSIVVVVPEGPDATRVHVFSDTRFVCTAREIIGGARRHG